MSTDDSAVRLENPGGTMPPGTEVSPMSPVMAYLVEQLRAVTGSLADIKREYPVGQSFVFDPGHTAEIMEDSPRPVAVSNRMLREYLLDKRCTIHKLNEREAALEVNLVGLMGDDDLLTNETVLKRLLFYIEQQLVQDSLTYILDTVSNPMDGPVAAEVDAASMAFVRQLDPFFKMNAVGAEAMTKSAGFKKIDLPKIFSDRDFLSGINGRINDTLSRVIPPVPV